MSELTPTLSVVVIGRNEGARLTRCLKSILAMEPVDGGFEVIYVDSGSTDSSLEVAAGFGAKVLKIEEGRPTAARGRNLGWRAARGPWILFLDGDTILNPSFPRVALAAATDDSIASVYGHRREIYPNANFYQRVLDLDWIFPLGQTEFCGGDTVMRRSALEAVGGYDSTLIAGEEPEMCSRMRALGYVILHIDAQMTLHDLAITRWSQYWRRASRTGYAYAQISTRTRDGKVPLWVRESAANRKRAVVLMAMAASLIVVAVVSPVAGAVCVLLGICLLVRSAWRARWKSKDPLSLFLYAIHSHLQQIPIFFGQLEFQRDLKRNERRGLIEYK
jgi:cellulose synthase/poly-beta-1,6-N-acetylglucosamine synthase-like glycosyltransferase